MPVKKESRILLALCLKDAQDIQCNYCIIAVLRGRHSLEEMLLCSKEELLSCFDKMKSLGETLYTDNTSLGILEKVLGDKIDDALRRLDLRVFPEGECPDLSDWYKFLGKLGVQVYKLCKNVRAYRSTK